jgi:hypothetical protein
MRIVTISLIAGLAGCASQPAPDSKVHGSYLEAVPGTGSVAFRRASGDLASSCSLVVLVDAAPAADLGVSERIVLHLPAGEHVLSVKERAAPDCTGVNAPHTQAHVTAGGFSGYLVAVGAGGITLTPAAF